MTIHGAHQSTFVLTRPPPGPLRRHRPPARERLPFIGGIPFGHPGVRPVGAAAVEVTVHFGTPFDGRVTRRQARDPDVLRRCHDEITTTCRRSLDRLARAHPYPVLTAARARLVETLRELRRYSHADRRRGVHPPAHDAVIPSAGPPTPGLPRRWCWSSITGSPTLAAAFLAAIDEASRG